MIFLKKQTLTQVALAMIALFPYSFACSNAGKGDPAPQSVIATVDPGADATQLARIVITPKGQWNDLKGYIVGKPDHGSLTTLTDSSKPGFLNMAEGVYDIVLEAQVVGLDGKTSPAALRISGVKVVSGVDTPIRDVDLKPYIKLQGKILLNGEANYAGVGVSIPGTPLTAVTAGDGSYSLANVPAGIHALQYTLPGYNPGFINAKDYRADTELPAISLTKDSVRLESGIYYIGPAVIAGSTTPLELQLAAPGNMTRFRYGPSEALSDRPWTALQSSVVIDLPPGDAPEIFVQYSVDERQLSQIFSVKIPLEN